ncbi:hypothetical protein D5086_005875 [Populus alba]|uniref:Uncharacterized protein n=1 Tax=Populus alba TaxID=43335 RepID=A0ACC4CUV5_POPAL
MVIRRLSGAKIGGSSKGSHTLRTLIWCLTVGGRFGAENFENLVYVSCVLNLSLMDEGDDNADLTSNDKCWITLKTLDLKLLAACCKDLTELRVFPSDPFAAEPNVSLTERGLVSVSEGCPKLQLLITKHFSLWIWVLEPLLKNYKGSLFSGVLSPLSDGTPPYARLGVKGFPNLIIRGLFLGIRLFCQCCTKLETIAHPFGCLLAQIEAGKATLLRKLYIYRNHLQDLGLIMPGFVWTMDARFCVKGFLDRYTEPQELCIADYYFIG